MHLEILKHFLLNNESYIWLVYLLMQYETTMKFCGWQHNHHYIIHAKFHDLIMHIKTIIRLAIFELI